MTSTPNNGRAQGMDGAPRDPGVPRASIFRRAAFALVLLLLLATPLLLLLAAVSTGSALHDIVDRLTVIWFPLWACSLFGWPWTPLRYTVSLDLAQIRWVPRHSVCQASPLQTSPRCSSF